MLYQKHYYPLQLVFKCKYCNYNETFMLILHIILCIKVNYFIYQVSRYIIYAAYMENCILLFFMHKYFVFWIYVPIIYKWLFCIHYHRFLVSSKRRNRLGNTKINLNFQHKHILTFVINLFRLLNIILIFNFLFYKCQQNLQSCGYVELTKRNI